MSSGKMPPILRKSIIQRVEAHKVMIEVHPNGHQVTVEVVLRDPLGKAFGGYLVPNKAGPSLAPDNWSDKVSKAAQNLLELINQELDNAIFPKEDKEDDFSNVELPGW